MSSKNRTLVIVLSVIALVVVLAGAAVLLTGGDGDGEESSGSVPATAASGSSGSSGSSDPSSEISETRPVEPTGIPLDPYDETIADPMVGTPAPAIQGQAFDGSAMTIGGPTGNTTMLVFLAHWCPHCNAEIPELIELNDRGDMPADLDVIGISTGVRSDRENYPPSRWFTDKDWPWPVMVDDEQSTAFLFDGGTGFPYVVLLDADGNVLSRATGHRPADQIKAWLTDNLG